MYKYKCSKEECQSHWVVDKGTLNGFVLTCPVCGKGRGVFVEQVENIRKVGPKEKTEKMIISANKNFISSIDELNKKIEIFADSVSIEILNKEIESLDDVIEIKIEYVRCKS